MTPIEEQIKAAIFEESHDLDFQFIPWSNDRVFRFVIEQINKHAMAAALAAEHQINCGRCQRYGKNECDEFRSTDWHRLADEKLRAECDKWLAWSGGQYPDDSPGDVIHAEVDGTIILDDGITTWNPLHALKFITAERDAAYVRGLERALKIAKTFWYDCETFDDAIQAEIDKAKGNP